MAGAATVVVAAAAAVTLRAAGVISRVADTLRAVAATSAEEAVLTMPGWVIMPAVQAIPTAMVGGSMAQPTRGTAAATGARTGIPPAITGILAITAGMGMGTLPALTGGADPFAYATYWWGGVPYYYANDVYYTYNPDYEGYVATDPPPVTESGAAADGAGPAAGPPPSDGGAAAGQIFMYPKNGQSAEQQATDKAECQQWAQQQAGQVAQNGSDYQRAMIACAEGRGYSTR